MFGSGTSVISLLVELVIGCIIIYGVYVFLGMLALPQQVKTLILLIIAVIAIIFLAGLFGVRV